MDDSVPSGRPAGLVAVCVLAILLAVLGSCWGVLAGVGAVFGGKVSELQAAQLEAAGGDGALAAQTRVQLEVHQAQLRLTQEFMPVTATLLVFHFVVVGLLLAGGAVALALKPIGRVLLLAGFGAGIALEIARSIADVVLQLRTLHTMRGMVSRLMEAGQQPGAAPLPPGFAESMDSMMAGASIGGIAIGLVWAFLKLVYYVVGTFYLNRADTRRAFH
jgi:hypothetical protein